MAGPGVDGRPTPPTNGAALVRRAALVAGPDRAPSLVLLHGTRRTRSMWRHQVDGLADAFRVVAVDLPGHGRLIDVPFRLADAATFVGETIEEVGGGRAIVVGQSLGGYVAMELAARRPELVAGLVIATATAEPRQIARRAPRAVGAYLLGAAGDRIRGRPNTGLMPDPGTAEAGVGAPGARTAVDVDRRGSVVPFGPGGGPEGGPDDGHDGHDGHDGTAPATAGWLFKGGTRALVSALGMRFIPRLAAYPGPTLFVNGADDEIFRRGERAFLAAAARGRLEVIQGTGHLANEEQPAAFNAAVRRFAAEIGVADPDT